MISITSPVLAISVEQAACAKNTYELPEDDQQLRLKHVTALLNK